MSSEKVVIFDTTLRDGEQSPGASLSISEKLEIAQQLAKMRVDIIEAGFPVSSPAQFEATRLCAENVDGPVICGLARASSKDIEAAGEATEPMGADMKMGVEQKDWKGAAVSANNLSELYLTLGEVGKAVEYGRRCVEYADKSGDGFMRVAMRTTLAGAFHQAGEVEEARGLFAEAERMQQEEQPGDRYLYSVWGHQYCDLLLAAGKAGEVKERGQYALDVVMKGSRNLLDIALNKLSIGRAVLAEAAEKIKAQSAKGKSVEKSLHEAKRWLDEAVAGLRKAGQQDDLVRGRGIGGLWGITERRLAIWRRCVR